MQRPSALAAKVRAMGVCQTKDPHDDSAYDDPALHDDIDLQLRDNNPVKVLPPLSNQDFMSYEEDHVVQKLQPLRRGGRVQARIKPARHETRKT